VDDERWRFGRDRVALARAVWPSQAHQPGGCASLVFALVFGCMDVDWWPEPVERFRGAKRLASLQVYFDFDWYRMFGHTMRQFPHGQSLASLVKRDCPKHLSPALLLTERDDIDAQWIETEDQQLVIVVPINDYVAHSDPDPTRSAKRSSADRGVFWSLARSTSSRTTAMCITASSKALSGSAVALGILRSSPSTSYSNARA
jgi:hypothetical protein